MPSNEIDRLIAEARRQKHLPLLDRILAGLGYRGDRGEMKRQIVATRPLRWLWQARCALILHRKWNLEPGNPNRVSLLGNWHYAASLAEMLDETNWGYLSPVEAIDEDRQYWED